jgi:putative DNA primase/helicase
VSNLQRNVEIGYGMGWSFTPLAGKRPTLDGWQKRPRETLQQALLWAERGNVGLRTGAASGGVLVVDLDAAKTNFDKAAVKALNLPATITAVTGGGGWHLYFRLPAGVELGNSSGRIAPGVDTRGDGGQVVYPGSVHPETGKPYAWMDGRAPGQIALADLPANLLAMLVAGDSMDHRPPPATGDHPQPLNDRARRYALAALDGEARKVAAAAEGTRNSTLNEAAYSLGQLIAGGLLDRSTVEAVLADAAKRAGLPAGEITATIASGIDSGAKSPRTMPESPSPAVAAPTAATDDAAADLADAGGAVRLGEIDPDSKRLVLSTRRTLPTARAYLRAFHTRKDGRTLHAYAGTLYAWNANAYREAEDEAIRHRLQPWLHDSLTYSGGDKPELVPFPANPATVNAALDTIRSAVHIPVAADVPFWLSGRDDIAARDVLPCHSMSLHIPTAAVLPPTPDLFTFNALDFDFDPEAPVPEEWIAFLRQLWPDDGGAIDLLQEWFGYCLTPDTGQQKMLLLVGPRRSGKGTIGRVMTELIGKANVAGPTTDSLGETFGLQQLIGKSLAIISDARFSGPNAQTIVERLLCISGEDVLTIRRMYQDHLTAKLNTRFAFLANELPRLRDAAGALAGRFLVLTLRSSWYGHEDIGLFNRLRGELPGILNWALGGWERLHARGKFVTPDSSAQAVEMLADLTSPVAAFVRERCEVGERLSATVADLYAAWKAWCEADGRDQATTRQSFGRELAAVCPGVRIRRNHLTGRFYEGIGLPAGDNLPAAAGSGDGEP